jgi:hypothetical protein
MFKVTLIDQSGHGLYGLTYKLNLKGKIQLDLIP